MLQLTNIPTHCTIEEAVPLIKQLGSSLGLTGELPDVRTLRLWRTKKLLSIEGRRFTRRNIYEVLVLLKLRQEGLTQQAAAKRIQILNEERLLILLNGAVIESTNQDDAASLITVHLLARGILELHRRTSMGAVVGHTDSRKTGNENTPKNLQQAMARLGRQYITEGQEDRAASIHQLLRFCMTPLISWAPRAISELEKYQHAILIDPIYRIPNEDCEVIAEEDAGTNLSDLIERHLHEELCNLLKKLGKDADQAYTLIREFIGRHPLATTSELQHLYLNPELNDEAIAFVRGLYQPVHAHNSYHKQIQRCAYCNGLIAHDGFCVLAGCRDVHIMSSVVSLPLEHGYLARPEVLKYWVDPALEELRVYDALCQEKHLHNRVHLYPHSDWCDISIDEEVGVDVKDYHDPVRLAQRLNHSIGNLSRYPDRILAIAQRRWSTMYRDRLHEQLQPERRRMIRIMSVNQTIDYLLKVDEGEHYAEKT